MHVDFQYAYLTLTLPFLVAWGALYLFSKRTRREQLVMSLIIAPVGVLSELFYFSDYWMPASVAPFTVLGVPVFLEDALFGFAIGGIGAVIYEVLFRKRLRRTETRGTTDAVPVLFVVVLVSVALYLAGLNSIFASSAGLILGAVLILMRRRDLLRDAVYSGIAVMLTMFVLYRLTWTIVENSAELVDRAWLLAGTPLGTLVFGIPLTELVWGFAWGMFGGPIYEYARGLRFRS